MKGKRNSPPEIIRKLREADRLKADGQSMGKICQTLEVSEQTYHRWKAAYGSMSGDAMKRLKDLAIEIAHLMKRPVGRPSAKPVVLYHRFEYRATSWPKPRTVVAKVEWHRDELIPRIGFVVTNMRGGAKPIMGYNGPAGPGTVPGRRSNGNYALRKNVYTTSGPLRGVRGRQQKVPAMFKLALSVLLCVSVLSCRALADVKYVTAGEQFDGKFYSWPGFDDPREAEHMATITRQVVTPHIRTAVPYSQGPPQVLFICPRFAARPTIELCQRFDIREQHALVALSRSLTRISRKDLFGSPGDTLKEVTEGLEQGLASKPEVVVVYDFAWRLLPEDIRQQIAAQVRAGAGLVLWNLEEGNTLPKDLASPAQDTEAARAIVACSPMEVRYRFGTLKAFFFRR